MHHIYVIQNKLSLKLYVGQTNRPAYRWWKHKHHASKGDRDQPIYLAIRKYGEENFTFTVIESFLTLDECNEAESFWIEFFQARKREFGYNIAYGGDNRTLPDAVREKISQTLKGKPSNSPATTFKPGHKMNIGSEAYGSILNDDKVREIRLLIKTGMPQKDIAKMFGVSVPTISMIGSGKIWKHVI